MCCRKINRFGDLYVFPKEEITVIDQLKPGDHIAFEQYCMYWHHMIVEEVDKEQGIIHVIHYYNTAEEFLRETVSLTMPDKALVRQDTFVFKTKTWHRIVYEKVVNNAEEVLIKAKKSLDFTGYNAFVNNCEHFCTWCKINKRASPQIEYLELWILRFLPACHLRLLADVGMVARKGLPQSLAKGIVVGVLKCVVNAFGMVFEFVVVAIE